MYKLFLAAALVGLSTTVFAQTDSSAYFLQKGIEEKTRGRRLESLKQFEKAYSYKKNDPAIVRELAAADLALRRYGQAREKYQELEKLGDQTDSTYRQLMQLSFNMRQYDDVIKYA